MSDEQLLQLLTLVMAELKSRASRYHLEQTQKDLLSSLQHNAEILQAAEAQRQQRVQEVKNQTEERIKSMQDAVLNAINDLKATRLLDN